MPGRSRPFLPGNCANPRGRPRSGETLAEYVRFLGGPDGRVCVDRLHALAPGDNAKLAMPSSGRSNRSDCEGAMNAQRSLRGGVPRFTRRVVAAGGSRPGPMPVGAEMVKQGQP